ncbi:MAG: SIMPL domain-containing protein, partial [Alcaligenaceae bacterium]|nr:SIMPL domain-containing protein [Alcaligenaceae bacterium]
MNLNFSVQARIFSLLASLGLALFALSATSPALAQGEVTAETKYPYASLRAEAVREVPRDTVRITLAADIRDSEQAEVAASLSRSADSVMKQVKGKEGIKVYSGNFQVWPMNDKDGRISEWRGRTEIILESTDFEAASKLAAQVSDRMPIVNLDFFVAPQERARHEAELLQEAATAFRDRAAD